MTKSKSDFKKKENYRRKGELINLKKFISSLDFNEDVKKSAIARVVEIADEFRKASAYIVDEENQRFSGATRADIKKSLKALKTNLARLAKCVDEIPISHLATFHTHLYKPELRSHNILFSKQLSEASKALDTTLEGLTQSPDKSVNPNLASLALQVALVLRDIFNTKISTTPDTNLGSKSRPMTAFYAKLLRQTLSLARVHSYDSGKVIKHGIALLKDPELPHNLKS